MDTNSNVCWTCVTTIYIDHVISDCSYHASTGRAGTISGWWRELPNWMWEEAGEGAGHQDPPPHPTVQEVNVTSAGNPGIEQALQPLVLKLLVLQDIHGMYSTVLTYMHNKWITCTQILNTINSLNELSCIIGTCFTILFMLQHPWSKTTNSLRPNSPIFH